MRRCFSSDAVWHGTVVLLVLAPVIPARGQAPGQPYWQQSAWQTPSWQQPAWQQPAWQPSTPIAQPMYQPGAQQPTPAPYAAAPYGGAAGYDAAAAFGYPSPRVAARMGIPPAVGSEMVAAPSPMMSGQTMAPGQTAAAAPMAAQGGMGYGGQPNCNCNGQIHDSYDAQAGCGYERPNYGSYYGAPAMDSCGCDTNYCAPYCAPPTLCTVYAGALLFFRDDENHKFFSFDSAIESNQLLDFRDAQTDFLPGIEIGLTRFDCCLMRGWEGLYWGLYPEDETAIAYAGDVTGNLDPIYDFSQLDYNGNSADAYTNAAAAHRLRRSTEFHNAELNRIWGLPLAGGCGCSPWTVRTLAGFRYFRFEENLEFAADVNDTMFTGEADELYYTIDTENNLYGLQIGGYGERSNGGRLSCIIGAKAGVYCNSASATSRIGGSAGTAVINNGPNVGRAWYVEANKEDVAFLGEAKAGLAYQLGWKWRLRGEYRVLGVSGVALPTNQIYHDLRGINDVQLLGTNGSLFLHGVFVGAERVF